MSSHIDARVHGLLSRYAEPWLANPGVWGTYTVFSRKSTPIVFLYSSVYTPLHPTAAAARVEFLA